MASREQKDAERVAKNIVEEFGNKYPDAIDLLQEGLEDSLQFYYFPQIDKRKISSTNALERINEEIRIVSIFPSKEAYLRLIVSYLIEYTEDWLVERSYMHPQKLQEVMDKYEDQFKVA